MVQRKHTICRDFVTKFEFARLQRDECRRRTTSAVAMSESGASSPIYRFATRQIAVTARCGETKLIRGIISIRWGEEQCLPPGSTQPRSLFENLIQEPKWEPKTNTVNPSRRAVLLGFFWGDCIGDEHSFLAVKRVRQRCPRVQSDPLWSPLCCSRGSREPQKRYGWFSSLGLQPTVSNHLEAGTRTYPPTSFTIALIAFESTAK